jgi:hypothetical protein
MGDGAALLWSKTITTAIAAPGETQGTITGVGAADQVILSSVFVYGSGGTTAKAWLQTSFDNGTTWVDVASHAFALASATKVSALSSAIAPASQAFAPSDGALADNTVVNGVIGDRLRVKVITTGTYAGNTTLNVHVTVRRRDI